MLRHVAGAAQQKINDRRIVDRWVRRRIGNDRRDAARRGQFVPGLLREAGHHPEIADLINTVLHTRRQAYRKVLAPALARGELLPSIDQDLLIDLLLNSDGDITLVPTGPLTNIAAAIRSEPAILPKIKAISLMGGAIGLGNTTPAAEFNIYTDPEAAAIVFSCGRPITMCPLEVTHQALATENVIHRLRAVDRPVATFAADLLVFFADRYRNVFGFPAAPVHDPCAVATVIDPTIIKAHTMHVEIETTGEWTSGRTVCDVYGKLGMEPNARVGYALDVERFWDMVISTILTY